MKQYNGQKCLAVWIPQEDHALLKEFCQRNGFKLYAAAAKAVRAFIEREQSNEGQIS